MKITRKKATTFLAAASTCAWAGLATAQAQPAGGEVVRQDFENNEPGWVKIGDGAQVSIAREPEDVHGGNAALQFNYTLQPKSIAALALANPAPLAQARTISFWAKAEADSALAFAIQERGGGLWMAIFSLPEGKWQRVELRAEDFINGLGPNDPPDADGVLSMDKIEWAGLGDFAQYVLQEAAEPIQKLFGIQPGPRTLWLDDVAFDPTNAAPPAPGAARAVDAFGSPQLNWLHLAGTAIERQEKEFAGAKVAGLSLSYTQAPGQFSGAIRRLNSKGWAGATRLSMLIASDAPATIAVQLEERGGGKYFAPLVVPGDGEPKRQSLSLTQFTPSEDSRDGNGHIDIDQVQQILLLDAAALNPQATRTPNTLWLGDIKVEAEK